MTLVTALELLSSDPQSAARGHPTRPSEPVEHATSPRKNDQAGSLTTPQHSNGSHVTPHLTTNTSKFPSSQVSGGRDAQVGSSNNIYRNPFDRISASAVSAASSSFSSTTSSNASFASAQATLREDDINDLAIRLSAKFDGREMKNTRQHFASDRLPVTRVLTFTKPQALRLHQGGTEEEVKGGKEGEACHVQRPRHTAGSGEKEEARVWRDFGRADDARPAVEKAPEGTSPSSDPTEHPMGSLKGHTTGNSTTSSSSSSSGRGGVDSGLTEPFRDREETRHTQASSTQELQQEQDEAWAVDILPVASGPTTGADVMEEVPAASAAALEAATPSVVDLFSGPASAFPFAADKSELCSSTTVTLMTSSAEAEPEGEKEGEGEVGSMGSMGNASRDGRCHEPSLASFKSREFSGSNMARSVRRRAVLRVGAGVALVAVGAGTWVLYGAWA